MELYAEFDRSQFPIITINFTGVKENQENFQLYLEELENNYNRKEPLTLIFDMKNAPVPKMKYQLQQATWLKENENLIKTYCRGIAYIIPNTILRNILKFIFSIQKNPVPFKVFSTVEEGEKWVKSCMSLPTSYAVD